MAGGATPLRLGVPPGRPFPLPQGYRRGETAAAAVVVARSGYLRNKTAAEAITCAFLVTTPRMSHSHDPIGVGGTEGEGGNGWHRAAARCQPLDYLLSTERALRRQARPT